MLTIDSKIVEWANISESQLLEEIAIMLYQKKKLTFGQAAEMAHMSYAEFQFLLGRNKVVVNYGASELLEDFETLKKFRK